MLLTGDLKSELPAENRRFFWRDVGERRWSEYMSRRKRIARKSMMVRYTTLSSDTMTEQAKEKYEAAKEKASNAAGYLGQKMRTGSTEL